MFYPLGVYTSQLVANWSFGLVVVYADINMLTHLVSSQAPLASSVLNLPILWLNTVFDRQNLIVIT